MPVATPPKSCSNQNFVPDISKRSRKQGTGIVPYENHCPKRITIHPLYLNPSHHQLSFRLGQHQSCSHLCLLKLTPKREAMKLFKIKSNHVISMLKIFLWLPITFFLNPGMFIMSYKAIHDLAPAHPSNLTSCQFILCSPHDGPSLVLKHNKQILHTDPLFSGMLFSSCSDGSLTIWMCELKCYSLWRPFLAKTTLTTIPFLFCLQGIYHHLILDTCLLSVFSIRTSVP